MVKLIEVTAGAGGNAFLMITKDKCALYESGMAYCAPKMIENIKTHLGGRPLDYVLISHSHYDHVGGIPYIKAAFPNTKVVGAAHAQYVFTRPNALATIRELGRKAAQCYGFSQLPPYEDDFLKVDITVGDNDVIDLGQTSIRVMETPGHTRCSLTYVIDKKWILTSETTGCKVQNGKMHATFITGCAQSITSLYHCAEQSKDVEGILSPHYGLIDACDLTNYWMDCFNAIVQSRDFIINESKKGLLPSEIFKVYEQNFRDEVTRHEQPDDAFALNTRAMIDTVIYEHLNCIYSPYEEYFSDLQL